MQPVFLIFLGVFAVSQICAGGQVVDTGQNIQQRFLVPKGYERVASADDSFAAFLRQLPLKPHDSPVHYYNGQTRANFGAYVAVVDWEIGDRDLQQCADAVIRLRATYLYRQKRFDEIRFHFGNGFLAEYSKWRAGNRIAVDGNSVYWRPTRARSDTDESFWNYLEMVFAYASTASLVREVKSVPLEEMQIGDLFLQAGFPGHTVIVVDMAVNPQTGGKIFLLAQSYMPAQEIHLLNNLQGQYPGPWYRLDFEGELSTPDWTFPRDHLMRFKE